MFEQLGKLPAFPRSWDDVGTNLFVPEHYEFNQPEQMHAFMRMYPVAQMFTSQSGLPRVSAVPFVAEPNESGVYLGHLAARNRQVEAIEAREQALLLFCGPSAYISPRWFRKNIVAPTWSYLSVQARGHLVPVTDEDETWRIIDLTVAHMEKQVSASDGQACWTSDVLDSALRGRYLGMITAFRFEITALEGVCRLNQEKEAEDVASIVEGLRSTGGGQSHDIAALMHGVLKAR